MFRIPNVILSFRIFNKARKINMRLEHASFCTEKRFPTKIDPNAKIMTMQDIKNKIVKKLGLETSYTLHPKSREHLLQYEPKAEDLPPRNMNDSFTAAIIPLAKDDLLRNSYVTLMETVRSGRLMEDMDMFAVWICHTHLYIPKLDPNIHLPYTFVTILVDKIEYTDINPSINNNIRISGHVSWVGKTSMEIVVWLETVKPDGTLEKITKAIFLFAARNATNTKGAPVNKLEPANEYEKKILDGGNARQDARVLQRQKSLLKVIPTQEEQQLMHDNFIKTIPSINSFSDEHVLPSGCTWMKDTKIVDIDLAFPENRNAHNTIFGGFLMRKAYEISIINARLYARDLPRIKHISNIVFQKPIAVSSIIKMTTFVTYTTENYIQITCVTETRTYDTEFSVTNIFHFTYKNDVNVPNVIPKTYQESIWNLMGRREFRFSESYGLLNHK